ncbi:response regulator [Glaciimonas immobilis]|uniref:Response regulator of citrate/malate metabolism n=1 Tax=Glaciimonas immobilis TaxID=728004 RepID=A0A840RV71_9BURK|nr:response regulator [Glaciimonas immobilis]KAF3996107.1 response regulator [Glaciimonas immobilis]MBB5201745.1 response regulator of citrate/malate metabolism [Glaciimonas immobilis]
MKTTVALPSKEARTVPLRIFLVEDSTDVREWIIETVEGIQGVTLAGFSEEENDALKKIDAEPYDILILDIELKQGNGMSLLKTLSKSNKFLDNLKIIFSNNVSQVYRRAGEQYGVRFFFDKTSEFSKLRTLLEELGSNSR